MIRVSIGHVTIAGDSEKDFAIAISRFAEVQALAEKTAHLASAKAVATPKVSAVALATQGADYCAQWAEVNGKARFRMSGEEEAEYGRTEQGRQEAAKARLIAQGVITGESASGGELVTFTEEIGADGIGED